MVQRETGTKAHAGMVALRHHYCGVCIGEMEALVMRADECTDALLHPVGAWPPRLRLHALAAVVNV